MKINPGILNHGRYWICRSFCDLHDIVGRCISLLRSAREQCNRNRRKFSPQTKITGRAEKKVIHGLMARLMEFEGAEDYLDADYSLESANDLVWLIHVVNAVLLGTGE